MDCLVALYPWRDLSLLTAHWSIQGNTKTAGVIGGKNKYIRTLAKVQQEYRNYKPGVREKDQG